MSYTVEGTITIGLDETLEFTDGLVSSLDYLFKGIFYMGAHQHQGVVKTIPKAINFWAIKKIDEKFLEDVKQIILSIKRMSKIDNKIGLGYVEFDPMQLNMDDIDKFLVNSRSKIYIVAHADGIEHDLREIYETHYRKNFLDVMFISIDPEGHKVKAWVHTPFLIREIDI